MHLTRTAWGKSSRGPGGIGITIEDSGGNLVEDFHYASDGWRTVWNRFVQLEPGWLGNNSMPTNQEFEAPQLTRRLKRFQERRPVESPTSSARKS